VKDQLQCGSSPYFSAVTSLEGVYVAFQNGTLTSLSTQQVVDCSQPWGNVGCNGGEMNWTFSYVIKVGGIESEASYPYKGTDGTCVFDKKKVVTTISSWSSVPSGQETVMASMLYQYGPVASAVDASHTSFQMYKSGVYMSSSCKAADVDHGIAVTGYGFDGPNRIPFWKLKNSWDVTWGEQGYMKIFRGNNMCGIAAQAVVALV